MESLVEVEDFPGRLLHVAALWDNAELLEDLLNGEELQCLNARDSWGRTALHAAATNDHSRCVRSRSRLNLLLRSLRQVLVSLFSLG